MIYPLKNAFMGFPYMSNFPQRMFANICDSKPVRHHLVTPGFCTLHFAVTKGSLPLQTLLAVNCEKVAHVSQNKKISLGNQATSWTAYYSACRLQRCPSPNATSPRQPQSKRLAAKARSASPWRADP